MLTRAQAPVDGDREVAADAEVDALPELAAGLAADGLHDGGGGGGPEALRHREVGEDEVVGAGDRHGLRGRRLQPPAAVGDRVPLQSDLKHLPAGDRRESPPSSTSDFPAISRIFGGTSVRILGKTLEIERFWGRTTVSPPATAGADF